MQDKSSSLDDDSSYFNLKMLLNEGVDIGCLASAIEEFGIFGCDSYGRQINFSPDGRGIESALYALAQTKKYYARFIAGEEPSLGVEAMLLNYGWYRHSMPDFAKFNVSAASQAPPPVDKPLSTKERNTYLKLIAALCKRCEIDIFSRSAVSELRLRTEESEQPLSSDTLRKILNDLKDMRG